MSHRNLAVRLARLEQRAAACCLPAEAPFPPPEVLDTLSTEELYQLWRKLIRYPTPRRRADEAFVQRLSRLSDEELLRLYRELLGESEPLLDWREPGEQKGAWPLRLEPGVEEEAP